MTDGTQELSEIIREMRYRVLEDNGLTVNGLTTIEQETKQAIIDWHNKRELEARIEENRRWLTVLAPSMDENVAYNSDFHHRIAELKAQQDKE